jgi:2-polyprenyl-3-methyl-5-hydroxy-6-metoxy-1,4-benzoquinol methylase
LTVAPTRIVCSAARLIKPNSAAALIHSKNEGTNLNIVDRSLQFARGFILSYGNQATKKRFWDKEYHENKWHFAEHSENDCVYNHLERHARNGKILDLGCGSGNTCTELADSCYSSYLGVDISDEALAKASKRSAEAGRSHKNRFMQSDFLSFDTSEKFDVILFRESMYHVPIEKVKSLLDKFSKYLADDGVFIVRLYIMRDGKIKLRPKKMIDIIANNFPVVERNQYGNAGAIVIVFRPRHPNNQG